MFNVTRRLEQRVVGTGNFEQPARAVLVQIDHAGVGKQLLVESDELPGYRCVQAALGLLALDRTDLLPLAKLNTRIHGPIEKIYVLQQPHGISSEAEANAITPPLAPHVIFRI